MCCLSVKKEIWEASPLFPSPLFPESDIDIIVEFLEKKSLLELVRIERKLSEILGIKVDLLTEKSISPYLIDQIKEEMEVIYG